MKTSGSSAAPAGAVSSTPVPQFAFPDASAHGGATASTNSSRQTTSEEEVVAFITLLDSLPASSF